MKRYPIGWRLVLLGVEVALGIATANVYQGITQGWGAL